MAEVAAPNGSSLIQLNYQHNEEPRWQAHRTIPYSTDRAQVITAQALLAYSIPSREATDVITASLERRQ